MALFSKRHYIWLAEFIRTYEASKWDRFRLANYLAEALESDNQAFNASKFKARAVREARDA